jgi:hypothetical protein
MAPLAEVPLIPPQPDNSLAGSASSTGYLNEPAADLPPVALPTLTPEPAPTQLTLSTSYAPEPNHSLEDRGFPADCLNPPSVDLEPAALSSPEPMLTAVETQPTADVPRATPVEMPAESPFESLPVLELLESDSLQAEPASQPAIEWPPAPATQAPEPDLVLLTPNDSLAPEPAVAVANLETTAAFDFQPNVELPPVDQPIIPPESAMMPLLLGLEPDSALHNDHRAPYKLDEHDEGHFETRSHLPAAGEVIDNAITLRRSRGVEFLSWLHNHLPSRPDHVPADAFEPTWAEQRTARGLAVALAAAAALSVLPVALKGHMKLFDAPPWALWTVLLAAVQLVYAGWLANAPDWATVRVQMVLSAALTTIYAMVMTLVLMTPPSRALILGLDEVRQMAPAWCGLMLVLMAGVTWYCGRTSTQWRRQLAEEI